MLIRCWAATAGTLADDLLGLLCYLAIHAGVQGMFAQIEFVYEHVSAETSLDQSGFFITSLQAACMYAASEDPRRYLGCGHCGRPPPGEARATTAGADDASGDHSDARNGITRPGTASSQTGREE
jgi:hypothetical protein